MSKSRAMKVSEVMVYFVESLENLNFVRDGLEFKATGFGVYLGQMPTIHLSSGDDEYLEDIQLTEVVTCVPTLLFLLKSYGFTAVVALHALGCGCDNEDTAQDNEFEDEEFLKFVKSMLDAYNK